MRYTPSKRKEKLYFVLSNIIIPNVKIGIETITVRTFIIITDFFGEINLQMNKFIACPPSRVETGNILNIPINRFAKENSGIIL